MSAQRSRRVTTSVARAALFSKRMRVLLALLLFCAFVPSTLSDYVFNDYWGYSLFYGANAAFNLNSATTQLAVRFNLTEPHNITGLHLRSTSLGPATVPNYRIGLQTESSSAPSGTWIGGASNYNVTTLPDAYAYTDVTLPAAAELAANTNYYLVISYDSGTIDGSNYGTINYISPGTGEVIAGPKPHTMNDHNHYTLTTTGAGWTTQTYAALFFLTDDAGANEGFGIDGAGSSTNIYGENRTMAEVFVPDRDLQVTAIKLGTTTTGSPTCTVELGIQEGNITETFGNASLGACTNSSYGNFVRCVLSSSVRLTADQTYSVYLKDISGTCNSTKRLNWFITSAAATDLSFGGTAMYRAATTDNGSSWTTAMLFGDQPFGFTVIPAITSVSLSSTAGTNTTSENLTATVIGLTKGVGGGTGVALDWRESGTSIAFVNMNFDVDNSGGAGVTNDYSTYGNDGTVSSAAWNATGGWNSTGGFLFDGTAKSVTITDQSYLSPSVNDLTIMFWAMIPVSATATGSNGCGGTGSYFITKGGPTTWEWGIENDYNNRTCVSLWTNAGSGHGSIDIVRTMNDSQWHHYTTTIDYLSNLSFYIDGVLVGSTATFSSTMTNTANNVLIGRRGDSNYFNGSIDNVMIFNRTLSPQEVAAIAANRTDFMASSELARGDSWTACVTPNDGSQDGSQVCSNALLVGGPPIFSGDLDMNNDGYADLVTGFGTNGSGYQPSRAYYGSATGFSNSSYMRYSTQGGYNGKMADLNGDGALDYTVATPVIYDQIFYGPSNTSTKTLKSNVSPDVCVNDFNKDGYRDLFFINVGSDIGPINATIYWGSASGYSNASHTNLTLRYPASCEAEDVNNDGWIDLAVADNKENSRIFWNVNGSFNTSNYLSLPTTRSYGLAVGDLNNDTYADIVISSDKNTIPLTIFWGSRGGGYANTTTINVNMTAFGLALGDFDKDGWPEILQGATVNGTNFTVNSRIYWNNQGNFTPTNVTHLITMHTTRVSIADLNGDSWLDAVFSDDANESYDFRQHVRVYWNKLGVFSATNKSDIYAEQSFYTVPVTGNRNEYPHFSPYTNTILIPDAKTRVNTTLVNFTDLDLFFNDTEGHAITYGVEGNNSNVAFTFSSDGRVNLTPAPGWSGRIDNVWFTATDLQGTATSNNFSIFVMNNPAAPVISAVTMSSSGGTNTSSENVTAAVTASDADSDIIRLNYDWRKNGTSIAVLNMNFDVENSAGFDRTKDYSSFGNNGIISGAQWVSNGGWNGSGAYSFDGTNDYLTTTQTFTDPQNFSLSVWFRTSTARGKIIGFGNVQTGSSASYDRHLYIDTSGYLRFGVYNGTGMTARSSSTVHNNNWHHAVATFDGGKATTNMYLYVDGVLSGSNHSTNAQSYGSPGYWRIGYDNIAGWTLVSTPYFFNGSIDDVRVYNHSLSAAEVLAIYNNRSDLMVSNELAQSENWTACVTPNDGVFDGSTVCSAPFYTKGPPTLSTVTITSSSGTNYTNENLTASTDASDPDGDAVRLAYDWRVNGTSIAVLNMNFDVNNSAGTEKTRDHSTFGNNGTVNGASWSATGGWNGTGTYSFDGTDDHISLGKDIELLFNNTPFTICAQAYVTETDGAYADYGRVVDATNAGGAHGYRLFYDSSTEKWAFNYRNGSAAAGEVSGSLVNENQWVHVCGGYNGSHQLIYTNGSLVNSNYAGPVVPNWSLITGNVSIGRRLTGNANEFKGYIDDVMIFNRSLSAAEILALYQNRSDLIVAEETSRSDNWSVCVTPNDGTADGSTVCSGGLTIANKAPTLTSVILNSTTANTTAGNLTAYPQGANDIDNDYIRYAYDWRRNGTSIAVLNMNFDVNNSAGSGKTRDYSTFGNNGTIFNASWFATGGWNDTGAFIFNGTSGNITIPNTTINFNGLTDNYSISFWIKAPTQMHGYRIMEKWNETNPTGYPISFQGTTGSQLSFYIYNGSVTNGHQIGASIDGQWHMVTTVIDQNSDQIRSYLDGVLINQTTITLTGNANNTANLLVGDRSTGSRTFNGTIDNVMIFDRSLSAAEILALYQNRTDLIVSNELADADSWTACVTPNDGINDSSTTCSNSVSTYANAPRLTSVLVNGSAGTNYSNENITAYPQGLIDYQGDNVSIAYDWRVNGTSIAIINYNFDVNNSAGTNATKDYSLFGTNAIVYNATWNATGGWNGTGAYEFSGNLSNIDFDENDRNLTNYYTMTAWIYPKNDTRNGIIIDYLGPPTATLYLNTDSANDGIFRINGMAFNSKNSDWPNYYVYSSQLLLNRWYFAAFVVRGQNSTHSNISIYVNGLINSSVSVYTNFTGTGAGWGYSRIGGIYGSTYFNGTIDDVRIYNRSLSAQEVLALYQNRSDLIVAEETSRSDSWSVCVTPNDGTADGSTVCSGGLTIVNKAPTLTSVILNSTTVNTTAGNLTAYPQGANDIDNDYIRYAYDWRRNGTSIAVLNMNFDVNNSAGINSTRDYSTFGNNGTSFNLTVWNATAGWNGTGAYQFNGIRDFVNVTTTTGFFKGQTKGTIAAWVKRRAYLSTTGSIFNELNGTSTFTRFGLFVQAGGTVQFGGRDNTGTSFYTYSNTTLTPEVWYHLAGTWDADTDQVYVYVDGNISNSTSGTIAAFSTTNSNGVGIGANVMGNIFQFNGTIDNLLVFNRTLSPSEIYALYQNRTDLIVSNELADADSWTACVTPNDGINDSATTCSNPVAVVANNAPAVSSVIVNNTNSYNNTLGNLTAYPQGITDPDGDNVRLLYDWRRNSTSIAVLNMNFDVNNSAGTGKTRDYTMFGNNGTVNNATWSATGGFDGAGAFRFGPSNSHLQIPYTGALNTSQYMTATAWFNINAKEGLRYIFSSTSASGIEVSFLNVTSGACAANTLCGKIRVIELGNYADVSMPTTSISAGTWYHVALTYDGQYEKLYLNGALQNTTTQAGTILMNTAPFCIGGDSGASSCTNFSNSFNGSIDDVRIYNRSLSAAEILALYNNRTDLIVSNELAVNDNWSVCVTSNDGVNDGATTCSNAVTVTTTCVYPGSGNWNLDCGETCALGTNTNLGGNNLTFIGPGAVSISAIITDWIKATTENSCNVRLHSGGKLIGRTA